MINLQDVTLSLLDVEAQLINAVERHDLQDLDAATALLAQLIDRLGVIVGVDTAYLRWRNSQKREVA